MTEKIGLYFTTLFMLSTIFFRHEKPVMTQMTQMTAFSEKTSAEKKLGDVDIFFFISEGFQKLASLRHMRHFDYMFTILIQDIEITRINLFTPSLFRNCIRFMNNTYHHFINITFHYLSDVTL